MTNFTITPTDLPENISPVRNKPSQWIKVYEAMAAQPGQWLAIEGLTSKRASSLQSMVRSHSLSVKPQPIKALAGFHAEAVTDRSHGKPIIVYVRATPLQDSHVKLAM